MSTRAVKSTGLVQTLSFRLRSTRNGTRPSQHSCVIMRVALPRRTIRCGPCRAAARPAWLRSRCCVFGVIGVAPCVGRGRPDCSSSVVARAEAEDVDYDPELDAEERMEKTIAACEKEMIGVRTGRANPAMLSTIEVDYYGAPTPLQSLAGVSTPDSQTLMVNPFDKGAMKDIEDAIVASGLGFTPNNDGKVIRINVPALTEERRVEMTKLASAAGEEAKVAIRNIRRDVLKKSAKLDLAEDEEKAMEADVQKLTDSYVKRVDEIVTKKNKELTTV